MEFLDIGYDCLFDFCDRLDLATLCAIAGTCRELQEMAHKSFASRKIYKFSYRPKCPLEEHEFRTSDARVLMDMLKVFGHLITDISVTIFQEDQKTCIDIFTQIILACTGTLRSFQYWSASSTWNYDAAKDPTELFAALTALDLTGRNHHLLPIAACQNLTSLKINGYHWSHDLVHTFPNLKKFWLIDSMKRIKLNEFDSFMRRHPQLTDVAVDGVVSYAILLENTNLQSMTIWNGDNPNLMTLVGLQRLTSICIKDCANGGVATLNFVNQLACRSTLENLDLPSLRCLQTGSDLWLCLSQLKGLRVLKLVIDFTDSDTANGITSAIMHLPVIKTIEIMRRTSVNFKMDNYQLIDAICQRRNISMAIDIWKHCLNEEELRGRLKVSPEDSRRVIIRFGKQASVGILN